MNSFQRLNEKSNVSSAINTKRDLLSIQKKL